MRENLASGLEWLLAPHPATKYELHRSRSWFHIKRDSPSYYDSVFSSSSFEDALQAAIFVPGAVEQIDEGEKSGICRTLGRAVSAFRAGRSLRLNAIQRFSPDLSKFSRNLSRSLGFEVNTNAYLTPPGGKALGRHFDTHDVLVLQIAGKKKWEIYDSPAMAPLEHLPLFRHEKPDQMKQRRQKAAYKTAEPKLEAEFTLERGDLLYLPRGFWHRAEGVDSEQSLHLTLGIQEITYLELLNAVLAKAAVSDKRLREGLPSGSGTFFNNPKFLLQKLLEIFSELSITDENVIDAMDEMNLVFRRRVQDPHAETLLERKLIPNFDLKSTTRLAWASGVVPSISQRGNKTTLHIEDKTFEIEAGAAEFYSELIAKDSFMVTDVPIPEQATSALPFFEPLAAYGFLQEAMPLQAHLSANKLLSLPVKLDFTGRRLEMATMPMRALRLPFFKQTFARLPKSTPARYLTFERLLEEPAASEPPSFIFHISRCGSTLLSNALKAIPGSMVISETGLIPQLMNYIAARESNQFGVNDVEARLLLRKIVEAHSVQNTNFKGKLIFKLNSILLLNFQIFRELWPNAKYVLVIRDPVEVAASCLEGPPGWMRYKISLESNAPPADSAELSKEDLCAQMLGRFLRAGKENFLEFDHIIDYKDLDVDAALAIGDLFGLNDVATARIAVEKVFSFDSKQWRSGKKFEKDSELKRETISKSGLESVSKLAIAEYLDLSNLVQTRKR